MAISTLGEKLTFKIKLKNNNFFYSKDYGNYLTCYQPLICVRCVYSVCWCCMQVCMKCAQIRVYIMQIHQNSNIYSYLNFFVAVRLVTAPRYIPSQTLVGITPTGRQNGIDFPSQAEDRLFTSISKQHIITGPCKIINSCRSHSSKIQ